MVVKSRSVGEMLGGVVVGAGSSSRWNSAWSALPSSMSWPTASLSASVSATIEMRSRRKLVLMRPLASRLFQSSLTWLPVNASSTVSGLVPISS